MQHSYAQLVSVISAFKKPALVAISGFGGSGKSTLARRLGEELNAPTISVDSFWKNTTSAAYTCWDIVDFARLVDEVLQPFVEGSSSLEYGALNWHTNTVEPAVLRHEGLLIVEGVGLLRDDLMRFFSFSVWIDCPIDVAIARGKKRDREEYNAPQDEKWDGLWKANDLGYVEKYHPQEQADAVIPYADSSRDT